MPVLVLRNAPYTRGFEGKFYVICLVLSSQSRTKIRCTHNPKIIISENNKRLSYHERDADA